MLLRVAERQPDPWLDLLVIHLPINGSGSAGRLEGSTQETERVSQRARPLSTTKGAGQLAGMARAAGLGRKSWIDPNRRLAGRGQERSPVCGVRWVGEGCGLPHTKWASPGITFGPGNVCTHDCRPVEVGESVRERQTEGTARRGGVGSARRAGGWWPPRALPCREPAAGHDRTAWGSRTRGRRPGRALWISPSPGPGGGLVGGAGSGPTGARWRARGRRQTGRSLPPVVCSGEAPGAAPAPAPGEEGGEGGDGAQRGAVVAVGGGSASWWGEMGAKEARGGRAYRDGGVGEAGWARARGGAGARPGRKW